MRFTEIQTPPRGPRGMQDLKLNADHQRLLDHALRRSAGDPVWRARKGAEAADLLRLAQIAPPGRLAIEQIDIEQSLRAVLLLRVPVSCRPDAANNLRVAPLAVLGLVYRREVLTQRLNGMSFIQVLSPHDAWHPNIAELGQALCLGTYLPVGIPVVQLVHMAYDALSLTTVTMDPYDVAGLANAAAAEWFRQAPHWIPLTKTPLLAPDRP